MPALYGSSAADDIRGENENDVVSWSHPEGLRQRQSCFFFPSQVMDRWGDEGHTQGGHFGVWELLQDGAAGWKCFKKADSDSDGLQLSLVKLYLNYLFFVHGYFPAVETRHVQFSWEVLMQLLLTCFQQHALASCGAQDFSIYCRPNSQSLTTHGSQRRSRDVCEWRRRFFFFFFGSFWSGCACCFSLKEKEIKIFDETQNEWVAAALDDVILLSPK